jgi:hypothetical protein
MPHAMLAPTQSPHGAKNHWEGSARAPRAIRILHHVKHPDKRAFANKKTCPTTRNAQAK